MPTLKKTSWILGAALLTLLLANVLLFNAMPKSKRVQQPVVLDHTTADPAFERNLGALLQQPILPGNHLILLRDGEEIFAAMIAAIDAAEYSVNFETYEFWGEQAAGALTNALVRAAERGVTVNALPDYIGSRQAAAEKFERMDKAGVNVIRWRQPLWYQLSRFNHRTHRKLLIVDGHTGFIGGANVADNWLEVDDTPPYRDNHFQVHGPVVASLQAAFLETWLDASGELLSGDAYFPALEEAGDWPAQVVNSAPREGRHRVRKMFLYALAAAEHQVTISTAYFYPDARFLEALAETAERGVEVRILLPGENINTGVLRHASMNRWRPMLEAGVTLMEYQPRMYHSKMISIDDRWASIGSSNLDNRSLRINDEANLNVYHPDFARKIRQLIEEDIAEAKHYDLDRWKSRPWHQRLIGWVTMTVGAHL